MRKGYIYILANESYESVKVGKTCQRPIDRAQELSGSTAVPTRFKVVYYRLVNDCDSAEIFVHSLLESRGYRVSDYREFFKADLPVIIEAVMAIPNGLVEEENLLIDNEPNDKDYDPLSSRKASSGKTYPWKSLWIEARSYEIGEGGYFQDYDDAKGFYHQAAALGCIVAYQRIGSIYCHQGDYKKGLQYFKLGLAAGDYGCYLEMSELYRIKNEQENSDKSIYKFFTERLKKPHNIVERLPVKMNRRIANFLASMSLMELDHLSDVNKKGFYDISEEIIKEINIILIKEYNYYEERGEREGRASINKDGLSEFIKGFINEIEHAMTVYGNLFNKGEVYEDDEGNSKQEQIDRYIVAKSWLEDL